MPSEEHPKRDFPRRERLCRRGDIDRVFKTGRLIRTDAILIRFLPNGLDCSRFAVSVGRRVGNSVRRNRIKRLLREAYRLNKFRLATPFDIVVIPRPGWRNLTLSAIEPALTKGMAEAHEAFTCG